MHKISNNCISHFVVMAFGEFIIDFDHRAIEASDYRDVFCHVCRSVLHRFPGITLSGWNEVLVVECVPSLRKSYFVEFDYLHTFPDFFEFSLIEVKK